MSSSNYDEEELNTDNRDPSSISNATTEAPYCLCPRGYHGRFCEIKDESRTAGKTKLNGQGLLWPRYSGSDTAGYSSYTAYRVPFDTRQALYVRLHFRTWLPGQIGLLMLIGGRATSAKKDFVSLALVHGHVMLTWDVGGGPRRLVAPEPIDISFHTHSVLIGRRGKEAWLVVDTQNNVTGRAPGYLSSLDTDNILYVGGHDSWSFHQLPADLWRLSGFYGCVYDIRMSSQPHFAAKSTWQKPTVVASRNVAHCTRDSCEDHKCDNEAKCIEMGATYRCECSPGWMGPLCRTPGHVCPPVAHLNMPSHECHPGSSCLTGQGGQPVCICPFGRTGDRCEIVTPGSSTPRFRGRRSYLSVSPVGSLRHLSHTTIRFKPSKMSGILFLATGGPGGGPAPPLQGQAIGDYMALVLNNGSLALSYQLGSPGNTVVLRSPDKVSLDQWNTVTFRRKGADADLRFGGVTITSKDAAPPRTGTRHQKIPVTDVKSLSNTDTPLVYSVLPQSKNLKIQKLRSGLGIIDENNTELITEIPDNDTLVDSYLNESAGNNNFGDSKASGQPMSSTKNDKKLNSRMRRSNPVYLDVGNELFIGGVPEMTVIPSSVGPPDTRQPYEGCIGKIVINGASYKLDHQGGPFGVVRGQDLDRCDDQGPTACSHNTCSNGGTCRTVTEVEDETELNNLPFVCSCALGYSGAHCETPTVCLHQPCGDGGTCVPTETGTTKKKQKSASVSDAWFTSTEKVDEEYHCLCAPGRVGKHCHRGRGPMSSVRFSGRSFGHVVEGRSNSPGTARRDDIALNVTTTQPHGMLMWRGEVGGSRGVDWVGVGVWSGRVRVAWTLGGGAPTVITSQVPISDGRWHSVVVSRDGPKVSLYVDGRPTKGTSPPSYVHRDGTSAVYLGGFSDVAVATATEGLFLSSFVGCIRDVTLHAGAPSLHFDGIAHGRDLQPCD